MTDISSVLAHARGLSLSEETVDTQGVTDALAALKRASLTASSGNGDVDKWLSQEHMAGGVFATAATMNKRAELSGKGDPFNRQSRSVLISRYNAWAAQFVGRLQAFERGNADVQGYIRQLDKFHSDPVIQNP